jgi:formate hydrogenlyase subunit 6/NADH:ubiquinone oxidoreductase subunit I
MQFLELVLKPLVRRRSTVGYPKKAADSVRTSRVPRFQPERCQDDRACLAVCPTGAIAIEPADGARRWALDYGKCIFCAECIVACPSLAIVGSGDFELDASSRAGVVAEFRIGASGHA